MNPDMSAEETGNKGGTRPIAGKGHPDPGELARVSDQMELSKNRLS